VLSGGGSVPAANAPPEAWVEMVNSMQSGALSTRLGIPIMYGIDAVHGHGNVYKATIFPHNVGLGCTRYSDPSDRSQYLYIYFINIISYRSSTLLAYSYVVVG
jgi:beta-glucosidase